VLFRSHVKLRLHKKLLKLLAEQLLYSFLLRREIR
jgi:hypothetical protein